MTGAYGEDVLARARRSPARAPQVDAQPGLVAEHRESGFTGEVVALERRRVGLRDRHGRDRYFRLTEGAFAIDGQPVTLVVAPPGVPGPHARTPQPGSRASGAVAADVGPARTARASRIYVEGLHDAQLLERVWGEDLRELGVVVEPLEGVDDLAEVVRAFAPRQGRRLGVLVDHLVPGSKEARIAAQVRHPHVLVAGHPYVDVWEAVRPGALGIPAWPRVPKGTPWKEGVCAALGVADVAQMWRRVLAAVDTYADLETPLIGAVEQLLDFLTLDEAPGDA